MPRSPAGEEKDLGPREIRDGWAVSGAQMLRLGAVALGGTAPAARVAGQLLALAAAA